MKRYFLPIGLCLFLLLCLVPSGEAQECVQDPLGAAPTWNVGLKCTFMSASTPVPFTASGIQYWIIAFVPSGTVSGATLSIDSSINGSSWTTGGIIPAATIGAMTSAGSYGPNGSATTPSLFGRLNPTITGSGTVVVTLHGYIASPASGSGGCIATASTLSSKCGTTAGTIASITDGSSSTDCTVGGGTSKNACIYNGTAWVSAGSSGGGLSGLVLGEAIGSASTSAAASTPATVYTSLLQAANPSDDACQLAQAAWNAVSGNTGDVTIDQGDSSGLENCSVPIFPNFSSGGHQRIQGTRTILTVAQSIGLPGSTILEGESNADTTLISPLGGTEIKAANSLLQPVADGGSFFVPSATIASITRGTGGNTNFLTIVLNAGFPSYPSAVKLGPINLGRMVQMVNNNGPNGGTGVTLGDTLANGNGVFQVTGCGTGNFTGGTCSSATTTFAVLDASGLVANCSSCTGTAYLETYVVYVGNAGGNQFHSKLRNVTIDCQFVPGVGGYLDYSGEEGVDADPQTYNCMLPSARIHLGFCTAYTGAYCTNGQQSNAFSSNSPTGAINSGGDGWRFEINFGYETCSISGGCGSNGAAGVGWANGTSQVFCSTSGSQPYLVPDPCPPNWVGLMVDGSGSGGVLHNALSYTISEADPHGARIAEIGTTGVCVLIYGVGLVITGHHTEYCPSPYLLGGDTTINGAFGGAPTYNVTMYAGLDGSSVSGGNATIDIGSTAVNPLSGSINPVRQIDIKGSFGNLALGAGLAITDNITGRTVNCYTGGNANNDYSTWYHLGSGGGTSSSVFSDSACSTAFPQVEVPGIATSGLNTTTQVPFTANAPSGQTADVGDFKVNGVIEAKVTPGGVVDATTGFQVNLGAASGTNLCGNGTNYVSCLPGIPVDATNPATLLSTDRASYLKWSSGTALALPAVSGSFASNFPFPILNLSGSTLTITPNAGASDLLDSAASGTLLNNFAASLYQDSTSAPGHWWSIKFPTFAAFGSTCTIGQSWSTTAGFSCGITLSSNNPQTTTYQTTATDFLNHANITVASGSFTITLVASTSQPAVGQSIKVINYGSGTVTIAVSGQSVNGAATSLSLPPANSAQQPATAVIESDGTNYWADISGANAASLGGKTFAVPNPIGSTTPSTGAFTSLAAGSAKWNVNTSGLPTQSDNITLAGQGYPLIVGITSQKAETGTADTSVLAVTPASAVGTYQACVSVSVSSATSGVIAWTLSWTDSNGNAQAAVAQDLVQGGTAAPALTFTTSAAGNYSGCTTFDVNNAGAAITVKWVGGGTTAAKVTAYVTRII